MKFLSYKTCEKIHKLKIQAPTKWRWATDNIFVGQKKFYGIFLKNKDKDEYLHYFFKAYSFDDLPLILEKLLNNTKVHISVHELMSELASVLSRHGWKAMEIELIDILDTYSMEIYKKNKKK